MSADSTDGLSKEPNTEPTTEPTTLVIFGGTGDLAR